MMSLHGISVTPGSHVTATLKPEVIISNDEIRRLKISQRGCFFANEVTALFLMKFTCCHFIQFQGVSKWSARYSFITCTRESYANAIVKICGCLPFYLPYSGPPTRYCNLMDSFCLQQNRGSCALYLITSRKFLLIICLQ